MTALAANIIREYKEPGDLAIKCAASTTFYIGSGVGTVSGYANPAGDTLNMVTWGVAIEEVDNSSGSAGDKTVLVRRGKRERMSCTGASQAWVGIDAYWVDDTTVALIGTTTNDVKVGTICDYISATEVEVQFTI